MRQHADAKWWPRQRSRAPRRENRGASAGLAAQEAEGRGLDRGRRAHVQSPARFTAKASTCNESWCQRQEWWLPRSSEGEACKDEAPISTAWARREIAEGGRPSALAWKGIPGASCVESGRWRSNENASALFMSNSRHRQDARRWGRIKRRAPTEAVQVFDGSARRSTEEGPLVPCVREASGTRKRPVLPWLHVALGQDTQVAFCGGRPGLVPGFRTHVACACGELEFLIEGGHETVLRSVLWRWAYRMGPGFRAHFMGEQRATGAKNARGQVARSTGSGHPRSGN